MKGKTGEGRGAGKKKNPILSARREARAAPLKEKSAQLLDSYNGLLF